MDARIERLHNAASCIEEKLNGRKPIAGIVLGSGLGNLANSIENQIVIPYKSIPGFPESTAIGHKGNFIFGELGGKFVVAMQGRFHYYEGYPMELVTIGVRTMFCLGIKYLFVSNAAGGCNPDYKIGDLMIIKDHISLIPNPLIGPNMDEFGPRFPDMSCAYDKPLREKAKQIASNLGIPVHEGVYLGSTGPCYETPAEVRFYRAVGADVLGMSTIPEVIVARQCGIPVFGMSIVTNIANTDTDNIILNDSQDVVVQADKAATKLTSIFRALIDTLPTSL